MLTGFEASDSSTVEPEHDTPFSHQVAVLRQGGTLEVVAITWHAELDGNLDMLA